MVAFRARGWGLLLVVLILPACGVGGGGTLTPTVAPGIPAGVSARSGNGSVTISWQASPAAVTYEVQRSTHAGGPYAPVPGGSTVAATTFRDDGLANGSVFFYVVTAGNAFGQSPISAEVEGVPGIRARKVACGDEHSLALLDDGSLWAWGRNWWGQLGNGTVTPLSSVAVEVSLTDVADIAAGTQFSLALRRDGSLWAWGSNYGGQFGDGTTNPSSVPVPVPGAPPGIVSLTTDEGTVMVVLANGEVWGWGSNTEGRLGRPLAVVTVPAPAPIAGMTSVVAASVGHTHSLIVRADGSVWASGNNVVGQLGDGSTTSRQSFAPVVNLPPCTAAAAGLSHSVALGTDGLVWAWGNGFGTSVPGVSTLPVQVSGINAIRKIGAGQNFSIMMRTDGTVWGTGSNTVGELGNPVVNGSNPPVQVSLLAGIDDIAVGQLHTMAIQDDGLLWGWGDNLTGQLGNGNAGVQPEAKPAVGLSQVIDVQVGSLAGTALRSDHTLWTWGARFLGILGDGTSTGMATGYRVQVSSAGGLNFPLAVARLSSSGLALNSSGTAYSWGGAFGLSVFGQATPQPVAGLTGVTGVFTAADAAFLLKGGLVWGFGQNQFGEVGIGSGSAQINSPTQLPSLSNVIQVAGGDNWAMALTSGGAVWSWGQNGAGQLGAAGPSRTSPAQILTLSNVTAIAGGSNFGLAILSDQSVWGWGANNYGQLGGAAGNGILPRAVPGLSSIVSIAAGDTHSLAIQSGGTVLSWGGNQAGELGNGQINSSVNAVPTAVPGVPAGVKVSAGYRSSFVLLTDGTLWSWGDNGNGQLANGSAGWTALPVNITR